MIETFKSFFILVVELTFLFVGISLLLNVLQSYIPFEAVEKKLKKSHPFIAGLIALFFAFITPFCSCSTIPVIVNLLKNKVRFGVIMVFLFASPMLDPTILSIMTVLMGWKVTVLYSVITASLSLIMGLVLDLLGYDKAVKEVIMKGNKQTRIVFSWKNTWRETITLIKTVYPYLLVGAGVGAIISGLVPSELVSTYFGGDSWWFIPVAAVVGIPLYIRLATMIPISQILIANGMAIGPAMAMMISSAGASLPELILLKSIFRKKLIFVYVLSVVLMSTISGSLFYFIQ